MTTDPSNQSAAGSPDPVGLLEDLAQRLRYGPDGTVARSTRITQVHDGAEMKPSLRVFDRVSRMDTTVLLRGSDLYAIYDGPYEYLATLHPTSPDLGSQAEQAERLIAKMLAPVGAAL